jgi:perosamine synthetase
MRIGRVLPPAAARLGWRELAHGVAAIAFPHAAIRTLEDGLRRHFGVRHVFLVSSGTAALVVVLEALRSSSSRSDVVIPAYTCFSVPAAVLEAGLRPVLCDIERSTFGIDGGLLERVVNKKTLCVVLHHLFGIPSDVAQVHRICRARGIPVIEDAAQAMGVKSQGQWLGTIGDAGIFSVGRGKNITSGAGGIIVTNSNRLAAAIDRRVRLLSGPGYLDVAAELVKAAIMSLFIRPRLYWIPAAIPALRLGQTIFPERIPLRRLSGVQAGMLRHFQGRLEDANAARSATADDLARRIADERTASSIPYLRLPILCRDPIERDRVLEASLRLGLGMSGAYPAALDEIPELRSICAGVQMPVARHVAQRIVTLPTHHLVSEQDKAAMAACLAALPRPVRPTA